jgi:glycosyltransferase involved in cell wall biosynthesis
MSDGRRILLATDAWQPQVNGVVRTLETTVTILRRCGHRVEVVEPRQFTNFPFPLYPEIALSLPDPWQLAGRIDRFQPEHVHVATEGPVGLAVRRDCRRRGWRFTTSYHTKFPEYLWRMMAVPVGLSYGYLKWFHRHAVRVLVATPSVEVELRANGFQNAMARWSRGVDLTLFHPRPKSARQCRRPLMLYVGRLAVEKNVEAFLDLELPGTKLVIGDGPARAGLQDRHRDVEFLGVLSGEALAQTYCDADVFVFPSKTDTFGLVVLEALASGVPVAAYPVAGPADILKPAATGALDFDLASAVERALAFGRPEACVELARTYRWDHCSRQFLQALSPL